MKMCDPENEPRYQLCKVCGAKDCDCTMNSEQEILFDAIADWKSNDDWQFADKEAAWKFFFQAGAASRDAEIAELVAALEAVIPEVAGGNAGLIAYNKCKAALAKVRKP